MQQNFFGAPIPSLLVSGFSQFNEEQLIATGARLGLAMQGDVLCASKKAFINARHTPTVGELQLLDALAPRLTAYGTDATVTALDLDSAEEARVWQDMLRVYASKQKTAAVPPTLRALLSLSAHALKKAGRHADAQDLLCDTPPALAATLFGKAPRLSLDLGGVSVALASEIKPHEKPRAGLFVLAVRTSLPHLGNDVISRFLQRYAPYAPVPLMAIGEEGLGVHLPHLPAGIEIDLATAGLPDMVALSESCRDTVLVAMPPQYATAVLAQGAPATLIGRILHTQTLVIKSGPVSFVRLPLRLLGEWQQAFCRAACRQEAEATKADAVQIVSDATRVLGGVSYTENDILPPLTLLRDVCHAGGDMHGATLVATLRLPRNGLSGAVAPLLAYHRFTAELALPTGNTHVLYDKTVTAPTLTLGITAPRRAIPEGALSALDAALASGNFAALRRAIYEVK